MPLAGDFWKLSLTQGNGKKTLSSSQVRHARNKCFATIMLLVFWEYADTLTWTQCLVSVLTELIV